MRQNGPVPRSKDDPSQGSISTDFLQLDLHPIPAGRRTDWLAHQLRTAIAQGRLPVGSTLPASRTLAAELGVSRGLVTEAYRRLADDGQILGRGRAGTTVVHAPRTAEHGVEVTRPWRAAAVSSALDQPAAVRVDLTPGVPDLSAFPRSAWLRAERHVLGGALSDSFGYPDPAGAPEFRSAVAAWLARYRGMSVSPDQVVVVAGVAQGLALLARVLPTLGHDRIAVEDPGSFGARRQIEASGLSTVSIPVDEGGLQLEPLIASRAGAVLVTPAHQFPTGVVLHRSRRVELLEWASRQGLIVEDDYDAEHRYDRAPVTALQPMLPERVCYLGSVSKILAPALRVGWLIVPSWMHDKIVEQKRAADLGNAVLPQLALAQLMNAGDLERHLRLVRRTHRTRRDAMVTALRQRIPQAELHGASAGLHLTVTFDGPAGRDEEIARTALERGVRVHPLAWHRERPGPPGLVLGYAATSTGKISEGIAALAVSMPR